MKKYNFTIFICDNEGNLFRNAKCEGTEKANNFIESMKIHYEGKIATILLNGEFQETIHL